MKNKNVGIDIELDLFPCDKCDEWHPTLHWHDKYDNYLLNRRERFEETKAKRPILFSDAEYHEVLPTLQLIEDKNQNNCCICGCVTHFINRITLHPVCSDECKYADTNS